MSNVQIEDFRKLNAETYIDWERLRKSSIVITGATGLIGSNLVKALLYVNSQRNLDFHINLLVRNLEVAKGLFGQDDALHIIKYNLGDKPVISMKVDYIVHLASPTSSKYFIERPVDTISVNVEGTRAILEFAKEKKIQKLIYLSTMEVYGFPVKGHKVKENELGCFDTMDERNSYPIGKIAAESLCNAYYVQYGIPTVILRATQTFGPGVKYNDGRVFAQFMRCLLEKKNIVLKSCGKTERPYLYTADAVSAIIVGLLKGEAGNAYTIANPDTYCSIRDMAELVARELSGGQIKVLFDLSDNIKELGYSDTLYMNLSIDKIMKLGWEPTVSLKDMFVRMICAINNMT